MSKNRKNRMFERKNRLALIFIILFLPIISKAQVQLKDFIPERILLHTDRQVYASSEIIWFKVFTLEANTNRPSSFSKIAYLELLNQQGLAISRAKVLLKNGLGSGSMELPETLNSGQYHLVAYTQGMRNQGEAAFGKQALFLLQPGQAIVRAATDSPTKQKVFNPIQAPTVITEKDALSIAITTPQSTYPQRTTASIEITTRDANGQAVPAQVSMSVVLKAPEMASLFQASSSMTEVKQTIPISSFKFIPENKAMRLEGKVINQQSGQGEANVDVFLAFPGSRSLVYTAVTNQNGQFSYLLPELFGLKQVVLQIGYKDEIPLAIELEEPFHEMQNLEKDIVVLPKKWEAFANSILVNAQISQGYTAFAQPPVFSTDDLFADVSFFGEPDFQYNLDDFTRFPLPEFFYEIVPKVRVLGKFGEESLTVVSERESFPEAIPPLLLVDGVPVFDERTFLKINNKLIESTEIVTSPIWLNPGVFHGIIQLTSFDRDARCFSLPETALRRSFLTLLPQQEFHIPDYQTQAENTLPDFRSTLYWNPTIQTDASGKATIQFFTSDRLGTYEIRVEGLSENGSLGSGRGEIQVEKR